MRIDHTWHLIKRTLASQRTARTSAAEAIVVLGRRRDERLSVDAFLHAQRLMSVHDDAEPERHGPHATRGVQ